MDKKLKEKLLFLTVMVSLMAVSTAKDIYVTKNTLEFYREDQSLDDLLKLINERMKENEFYFSLYSTSADGSNSTDFKTVYYEKIVSFLDRYYPYMSDEQIDVLLDFVKYEFPNYDYDQTDVKDAWADLLNRMIPSTEVGYGLSQCMFLLSESRAYMERYYGVGREFLVLCNVVGYDQLVSAIFQNDVQQIVDVISKETSIDEESARRLVQLFDNYADEFGSSSGMLTDFLDEMQIVIASMIRSRCQSDLKFSNSLRGSILKNSSYVREDGLNFEIDPTEDTISFELVFEDYGRTVVTLPTYYLDVCMEESMLVDSSACHIIQTDYASSNIRSSMSLLSYIVGWNHMEYLSDFDGSVNQKKQIIYHSLKNYFSSEEEFNHFLIALDAHKDTAISKYFSIWKSQMMDGPVTFRKLLEYNSLREKIISSLSLIDKNYYEEARITEKNSEESMSFEFEHYYFSTYDYMSDFDEVLDYFHSQNSTYVELISEKGYFQRDWRNGKRDINSENDFVLSPQLLIQRKDLGNDHFIYYYVKPELFENGEFVSVFTNVLNQRVCVPVVGISTMIENEETKQMEDVVIVSIDQEPPSNNVHCKISYFSLCPKDKSYYYISNFY